MRRILASYRWRRRLVWLGVALAAAAGVAVIVLSFPNVSGPPPDTVGAVEDEPAPPPPAAEPKRIRLTPARRRELDGVLVAFVRAAVDRQDPELAWRLSTRSLRAGSTLAGWRRGDLPVFPLDTDPRGARRWTIVDNFERDVIVDLVLPPRRAGKQGPVEFNIELKAFGTGGSRHWLVDSFLPVRVYPPLGAKPKRAPKPLPPDFKPSYPAGRLSPVWFAVPGVLLALIVLVPAAILLVGWRRNVRAERAYRARLESTERQ